jgi:hypothetical protein
MANISSLDGKIWFEMCDMLLIHPGSVWVGVGMISFLIHDKRVSI